VRLTELGRRNEDDSRATSGRVRRGTESHESWPTWRQGGPPPICSREGVDHKPDAGDESQSRRGRLRNRSQMPVERRKHGAGEWATRSSSARGSIASQPREGQDLVDGSTIASSRSSGVHPPRGGDAS